ncbi:MAG: hypothetical protein NPINA01_19270 [Nitrospinaceae bacterium]|nr:MAG: hypothetical protein NPINA01_19270 [Nitrospinaceae bacterium]
MAKIVVIIKFSHTPNRVGSVMGNGMELKVKQEEIRPFPGWLTFKGLSDTYPSFI